MKQHFSCHQQGSLDGLCGVYAAITCVSHLYEIDESKLFAELINDIGKRLPWVMINGMGSRRLEVVLRATRRFCAGDSRRLRYRLMVPGQSLDRAWEIMRAHQRRHGDGSILLALSGVHEHWTCLERVTPRSLILADSSSLQRLHRAHLTVGEPRGARRHKIDLRSTFLLHLE